MLSELILGEDMVPVNSLSENIGLHITSMPSGGKAFMLYDTSVLAEAWADPSNLVLKYKAKQTLPVAVLSCKRISKCDVFFVNTSAARQGYGPTIYEVAMDTVGWLAGDRVHVSKEASELWRKFSLRSDVSSKPIPTECNATPYPENKSWLNFGYKLNYELPVDLLVARHEQVIDRLKENSKISEKELLSFLTDARVRYFNSKYGSQ